MCAETWCRARSALDGAGAVIGSQKYYPFGRSRDVIDTIPTDKLFTGHQQEGELYYMRARFYHPAVLAIRGMVSSPTPFAAAPVVST